jgi:hypothetical protein
MINGSAATPTRRRGHALTVLPALPAHNPLHGARIHHDAGLIASYDKLRNVDQVLAALEPGPVVAGLHWFEAMNQPDIANRC